MKSITSSRFLAMAAAASLSAAMPLLAGEFDLSWHTVDGGGGTSTGGGFSLSGTIGQHDAATPGTGGDFVLVGGFWAGMGPVSVPCLADLSGDSNVGPADLAQLLASWGPCPGCPADFNDDNIVGPADLAELLANWGPC